MHKIDGCVFSKSERTCTPLMAVRSTVGHLIHGLTFISLTRNIPSNFSSILRQAALGIPYTPRSSLKTELLTAGRMDSRDIVATWREPEKPHDVLNGKPKKVAWHTDRSDEKKPVAIH